MKTIFTLLMLSALLIGCESKSRPIAYGTDTCHHCKMTLMDPLFGAEVLTQKGKIYVFDDVNCLMKFLESGELGAQGVKEVLVADHSRPETLLDATTAFYLKSDQIRSPMASQIAAFPSEEAMKSFKKSANGQAIYLAWGELVTQFK
jgi:copper chaperone NosL